MVKIDPYNIKERHTKWKQKALINGITGISSANSDITLQYLQDLEQGLDVETSNKQGVAF